mgnify:CR=1 FL=1
MEQNQTSLLLQKAAPIILRELGPKVEPLIAEKVIMPVIRKVGPPLAKRIAYPLARRAGKALFNRVGFPLLNQLFNPDTDKSVVPGENAPTNEKKSSKFKLKKPGTGLRNLLQFKKSRKTPSPNQGSLQVQNPNSDQTSLLDQQLTQVSPVNPVINDSPELFNENQVLLPNFNTALPWRRRL